MLAKIRFIDEGETLRVVGSETFTSGRRKELPRIDKNGFWIGSLEIDYEYFTVLEDANDRLWIGKFLPTYPLFQKKDFENWLKEICPVKVKRTFNKRSGIITYYFG